MTYIDYTGAIPPYWNHPNSGTTTGPTTVPTQWTYPLQPHYVPAPQMEPFKYLEELQRRKREEAEQLKLGANTWGGTYTVDSLNILFPSMAKHTVQNILDNLVDVYLDDLAGDHIDYTVGTLPLTYRYVAVWQPAAFKYSVQDCVFGENRKFAHTIHSRVSKRGHLAVKVI